MKHIGENHISNLNRNAGICSKQEFKGGSFGQIRFGNIYEYKINNSPDKCSFDESTTASPLKASTVITFTTIYDRLLRNSEKKQTAPLFPPPHKQLHRFFQNVPSYKLHITVEIIALPTPGISAHIL